MGELIPAGHTDRYYVAVGLTAVTFSTTASASTGTPATPATVTSRLETPHGVW